VPQAVVDVAALYAALERKREDEGLSWRAVGRALGVAPSVFTRLADGRRPDVDTFVTLLRWLRMPAEAFILPPADAPDEQPALEPVDAIGFRLRTDARLSPEAAGAIEQVVRVAYQALRADAREP
jgi:transcriptional regulator with XRE-family HTH domain